MTEEASNLNKGTHILIPGSLMGFAKALRELIHDSVLPPKGPT
jgi:hypothetical protein